MTSKEKSELAAAMRDAAYTLYRQARDKMIDTPPRQRAKAVRLCNAAGEAWQAAFRYAREMRTVYCNEESDAALARLRARDREL